MQRLPLELIHNICTFCASSSLVALACANSFFQRQAEAVLYRQVTDGIWSGTFACLRSLRSNREKAFLVQSLTFDFGWNDSRFDHALDLLVEALAQMPSLLDLRIKMPIRSDTPASALNHILRTSCFQLRTLYCNHDVDIAGIIEYQSSLQFLGLFKPGHATQHVLEKFNEIGKLELRRPLPRIFTLECEGFMPYVNHLSVYPALSSGHAVFRGVAMSLTQDLDRHPITNCGDVNSISIFLESLSDLTLVCELLEDMGKSFHVSSLNISIKQEPQKNLLRPNSAFSKALSFSKLLKRLKLSPWPLSKKTWKYPEMPSDMKSALLKDWSVACPHLFQVKFPDCKAFVRHDAKCPWRPTTA
ncbi:hypothetical protein APHAL10511_002845 [Amanita phalloides]|nr:hypothetical protein APHAL10511_002845 [Amanita phalloides]